MAVKVIAQIQAFDWDSAGGLNIQLRLFTIEASPRTISGLWTGYIGMSEGDTASVINTKLGTFIKQYCIDNFDTTFGLTDTVRLIAAVDSIL